MKKTSQQIKELIFESRKGLEEMEWELANFPTVINEEMENRWVELTNKIIIREKYIDWLIKKYMKSISLSFELGISIHESDYSVDYKIEPSCMKFDEHLESHK